VSARHIKRQKEGKKERGREIERERERDVANTPLLLVWQDRQRETEIDREEDGE